MASEAKFSIEWQIYNKILPEAEIVFGHSNMVPVRCMPLTTPRKQSRWQKTIWQHLKRKNFSFSNIHSIVFDQLLPQIAKYYIKNEALKLMESGKLKTVRPVRVNGNSWAILGIKK